MWQKELEFSVEIDTWSTLVNEPYFPWIIIPSKANRPYSGNGGGQGTLCALEVVGIVVWLECGTVTFIDGGGLAIFGGGVMTLLTTSVPSQK